MTVPTREVAYQAALILYKKHGRDFKRLNEICGAQAELEAAIAQAHRELGATK